MDPYLGRKGVVRNLVDHLIEGTSVIVSGGPGMGKTTLLQQTAHALADGPGPVTIDLLREDPGDLGRRIPRGREAVVLLLDGCEALLPDPAASVRQIIQASKAVGKNVRGIVWAGGVEWGEWATAHRVELDGPIRFYPLIVLPPKEARPFLRHHWPKDMSSSELDRLLDLSGGHPYLMARILGQADMECGSFFSELWKAVDGTTEEAVLIQLIEAGSWVLLEDLKNEAGGRLPKKVLDRLAMLGLINRTLVEGAAAAKAVSPLLIDWVGRTRRTA